jgi:ribosome-associated translation inhibitor RaiA
LIGTSVSHCEIKAKPKNARGRGGAGFPARVAFAEELRGGSPDDGLVDHAQMPEKFSKPVPSVAQFPPGTVHLRLLLDRLDHDPPYTVRLTLRMPGRIIYVEQSADDSVAAYDLAVRALLTELRALKAALDGEDS